jgi:hypothetical protein
MAHERVISVNNNGIERRVRCDVSCVHVTSVKCDMFVYAWLQWSVTCLCTRDFSEVWHAYVRVTSVKCDMPVFVTCYEKTSKKHSNFRLASSADILTPPKTYQYLYFLNFTADIVSYVCLFVCVCVCVCVNVYPLSTVCTAVCQVNCYLYRNTV